MDYAAKLIQYVLLAVLGSTGAAALLNGGFHDRTIWIGLAITAAGAAVAFFKANTVTQPHAKQAIAIFTAGVLAVVAAWTDGRIDPSEWAQILFAVVGAVQIGVVGNYADEYGMKVLGQTPRR
jgi:drug/metabolite transporter (DMT)-like permease